MKILVTGATGFVGSHLCEKLRDEGHELFCLVRNQEKAKEFNLQGTLIQGALSSNSSHEWIAQLPKDLNAVIHTAGIVHSFSKAAFIDINTKATEQLITDLSKNFKQIKFVLISSIAASGAGLADQPKKETDIALPLSDYGKSKLAAENYLKMKAPKLWTKVIIRPPMVIGPRDPAILDVFKMVQSRFVLLAGLNAKQKQYSFVAIFDLIELISKSLELSSSEQTQETQIFFAAYEKNITLKDLIKSIEKKMKKNSTLFLIPTPLIRLLAFALFIINYFVKVNMRITPDKVREMVPNSWLVSNEKSKRILKLDYKWDLDSIIEVTLDDYKERGWL